MTKRKTSSKARTEFYDQENILEEVVEEAVSISLEDGLRQNILCGNRKRRLKNVSIKMDPLHVTAIKKLATMKSIPYQTLMRHWLAEDIRKELDSVRR